MVKETVAAYFVDQFCLLAPPLRGKNIPDIASCAGACPYQRRRVCFVVEALLRVYGRKRSEIILAFDQGCGLPHGIFIQRVRIVPDVVCEKWRADRFTVNPVTISLR